MAKASRLVASAFSRAMPDSMRLTRGLDVLETFLRDLATPHAVQSGRQLGLGLRPPGVGEREAAEGGVERRDIRGGRGERVHPAFDAGNIDVGAELLDILRRQRIGEDAGHATARRPAAAQSPEVLWPTA